MRFSMAVPPPCAAWVLWRRCGQHGLPASTVVLPLRPPTMGYWPMPKGLSTILHARRAHNQRAWCQHIRPSTVLSQGAIGGASDDRASHIKTRSNGGDVHIGCPYKRNIARPANMHTVPTASCSTMMRMTRERQNISESPEETPNWRRVGRMAGPNNGEEKSSGKDGSEYCFEQFYQDELRTASLTTPQPTMLGNEHTFQAHQAKGVVECSTCVKPGSTVAVRHAWGGLGETSSDRPGQQAKRAPPPCAPGSRVDAKGAAPATTNNCTKGTFGNSPRAWHQTEQRVM